MWKEIRRNYRRAVATVLTAVMTFTNVFTGVPVAFAAGEKEESLFLVEGSALREAIEDAKESGEVFDLSTLEMQAGRKSVKNKYEELLGSKKGDVYELDLEVDDSYALPNTGVAVFYNEGTDKVIFLFANGSDMVVDFIANVDGYATEPVTVQPNTNNVENDGEEELDYTVNYEAGDMVDDTSVKVNAELIPNMGVGGTTDTKEGEEIVDEAEEKDGEAEVPGEEDGEKEEESKDAAGEEQAEDPTENPAGDEAGDETEKNDGAEDPTGNGENQAENQTENQTEDPAGDETGDDESNNGIVDSEEAGNNGGDAANVEDNEEDAGDTGEDNGPELSLSNHAVAIVATTPMLPSGGNPFLKKPGNNGETEATTEGTEPEDKTPKADDGAGAPKAEVPTEAPKDGESTEPPKPSAPVETPEGTEPGTSKTPEVDEPVVDPEPSDPAETPEGTEPGTPAETPEAPETGEPAESPETVDPAGTPEIDNGAETIPSNGQPSQTVEDVVATSSNASGTLFDKIKLDDDQEMVDDDYQVLGELEGKAYDTVTVLGTLNVAALAVDVDDLPNEDAVGRWRQVLICNEDHEHTDDCYIWANVTVYSDEPYNDVMNLSMKAGEEWPDFGSSHLESMKEEPPFGVNVTLPTDGEWKSLDEEVISLTPDGDMTVNVDDGACQILYIYTDEDGVSSVAMWDVTVGTGIALLAKKQNKYKIFMRDLKFDNGETLHIIGINNGNTTAYCVEHGKHLDSYTVSSKNGYLDSVVTVNQSDMQNSFQKQLIGTILNSGAYTEEKMPTANWNDTTKKYAGAQLLIWEVLAGLRDKNFELVSGSNGYADYLNDDHNQYYKSIAKAVQNKVLRPSFCDNSDATAVWTYENGKYVARLVDTNRLDDGSGNYAITAWPKDRIRVSGTVNDAAINIEVNGNQLVLTSDIKPYDKTHPVTTITLSKTVDAKTYDWYSESGNTDLQDVVVSQGNTMYEISATAKVNAPSTHELTFKKIVKKAPKSEDIPNPGQKFKITVTFGNGTVEVSDCTYNENGKYVFSLGNGEEETITNVPAEVGLDAAKVTEELGDYWTNTFDKEGETCTITNTYKKLTPTYWTPKVLKKINAPDGVICDNDKFSFELKLKSANEVNGVKVGEAFINEGGSIGTRKVTGEGEATFPTITFTKEGTYTFELDENLMPKGYENQTGKQTITVNVTADDNGHLGTDTSTNMQDTYEFTNEYNYGETSFRPKVQKAFDSEHDRPEAKTFIFTLTPTSDAARRVSLGDSVSITTTEEASEAFKMLTFTEPGTYTFEIAETPGSDPGYGYDVQKHTLTIVVTDDHANGSLTKTVTVDGASYNDNRSEFTFTFTNTYVPESTTWTPAVMKTIDIEGDKDPATGRKFKFTLNGDSENPENGAVLGSETVVFVENGEKKSFDAVTFNRAGEYKFTISETDPRIPGYSQTESVVAANQTISVTVTDNNGQLEVTAVSGGILTDDDGNILAKATYKFTNKFDYEDTYWTPSVKKTMDTNGHKLPDDYRKTFTFKMTQTAGEEVIDEPQTVDVIFDQAEELFEKGPVIKTESFDKVTFKKPGTYKFTISEVRGDTDPTGYTYDTTEYNVTVVVKDVEAKDGHLQKTVTVDKKVGRFTASGPAAADDTAYTFEFNNTYKPVPVDVVLNVKKHIDATSEQGGYTYPNDVTFSFVLEKPLGSSGRFSTGQILETKTLTMSPDSQAPGVASGQIDDEVNFSALTYEKAGKYEYLIREERGDAAGFSYDSTVWTVTVKVEDKEGRLVPTVSYKHDDVSNSVAAEFINHYDTTKTNYTPQVYKRVEGDTIAKDTEFTFNLEEVQAESGRFTMGEVIDTARLQLKAGEALGSVSFNEITYNKPGTYKYLIKEVKPDDAAENYKGYTFDDTVWTLTVKVVDNGNALNVDSVTYTAGDATNDNYAEFTNRYTVTETKLNTGILKQITGDPIPAGQEYEFLFDIRKTDDQDGAVLPANTEMFVVVSSDRGSANSGSFGDITFKKAGVYSFEIAEKDNGIPGYTYDTVPYEMKVTIRDIESQLTVWAIELTKDDQPVDVDWTLNAIDNTAQFETIFTNVYDYGETSYQPEVSKAFTGADRPSEKTFTFNIAADGYIPPLYALAMSSNAVMPDVTEATVIGEGTAMFDEIRFTDPGTYKFEIKEVKGTENGYTYDETVWNLTVKVEDVKGKLVLSKLS